MIKLSNSFDINSISSFFNMMEVNWFDIKFTLMTADHWLENTARTVATSAFCAHFFFF